MNGAQQIQQFQNAGFSQTEIAQWSSQQRNQLVSAGFGQTEIDAWFGQKEPNLEPIRSAVLKNLSSAEPEKTKDFTGALEAGIQMSVSGLLARGKGPSKVLSEDAPMASRIAANAATVVGDIPWMAAGAVLGGAGGAPTGPGAAVTAFGGAFALPAGLRATLMDAYTKGEFKSFGDFWERASGIVWEETKGWLTGAATAAAGIATKAVIPAIPVVKSVAPTAAEIATMTTVGKALEGEVPKAQDFLDAAVLIAGAKGSVRAAGKIAQKLRSVYAETGVDPKTILDQAEKDPTVLQDIASENRPVPKSLETPQEPQPKNALNLSEAAVENPARMALEMEKSGVISKEQLDQIYAPYEQVIDKHGNLRNVPTDTLAQVHSQQLDMLKGWITDKGYDGITYGGGEPPIPPSRPGSSPEPTDPQKSILSRLSIGEGQKRAYSWDKFYTDVKDDLYPIRQIVDELKGDQNLPAARDPYKLARLTRGVFGKAQQFIENSPFKFDTYENVGKPLREIVKPVKNDLDGLRSYAVARRSVELAGRGIETGVPLAEAKTVVKEGGKYAQAFKELQQYQDHLVKYLIDSGVVSKDTAASMRAANQDYVPFYRLMDDAGGMKAGPGMSVRSPIKSIKGSERTIVDPLESIVKNTYLYTALAERNAVGLSLVDLAEKTGRSDIVKKVVQPAKAITIEQKEVQKFLEAHGIEGKADEFSIFRRNSLNPADDEIVVFRDGKREIYQVPKEVASAFKATDRETASMLVKMLAFPAKTLRAGATLAPDFMARNMLRDQMSATVFSKSGYVPVLDAMRGLMGIARRDEDYQAWLKSGGANAAFISMDRQYIQAEVNKIADVQSVNQKVWNVIKSPIELLRVTSELIENSTRLGEFKRATGGDLGKEASQAGAFESREVTLDFARIGAKTRSINLLTAFWNAQLEGMDRTVRAFNDAPFKTTALVTASITMPSVMLWWANHDDPRWKEIPNWEKDLFWIVMTKDHVFRIPKPFELGVIFGSVPERLLDKFKDDRPEAFKDFSRTVANTFGVNLLPTIASPVLEQMTNHSFFTDRPLIPGHLEKILPEYQYAPYTTEATKALGHLIGSVPGMHDRSIASPLIIENYIRGWSGTMGMYALQTADLALRKAGAIPDPVKPAATLADLPVIKAFVVRHPSAQAQSIQDFHEHYNESKKVVDTITYLAKQGDAAAALREARLDPSLMVRLDGIHQALSNSQQVIQLLYKNPNFNPDEKRQLIDATYSQMIQMASAGEQTIRTVRKALGPKMVEVTH